MQDHRSIDLSRLRILVVDDNQNMRMIVREILRVFGIRDILEAENGGAALDVMNVNVPDLVLTDWEMTPVSGLELVQGLRSRQKGPGTFIPVIMVTGYTEQSSVIEARNAGVDNFLAKPLSAFDLYSRMLRVIQQPRTLVDAKTYLGPDRRYSDADYDGEERRGVSGGDSTPESGDTDDT